MEKRRGILLLLVIIVLVVSFCNADYTLEIRAIRYQGNNKRDHNGDCCDVGFFQCDECDVDFHFCVRSKGTSALSTSCWYSAETSDDKANTGSINFPTTGELYGGAGLYNPITFSRGGSWPGSFQLMVRITDSDGSTADDLVDRLTFDQDLSPSSSWTGVISGKSYYSRASFTARFRVRCNANYYTSSCSVYCKPRDDSYGHYDCNSLGQKVCKSGWSDPGNNCLTPICSSGCSETGGYCNVPSECVCNDGWTGSLCNQCIPKEGCSTDHGHCDGPFTCVCESGYGGTLCDKDADVCGHQGPCKHDASCTNTGLDSYSCDCLPGYTGTNCEIDINECSPDPCAHGSCIDQINGYHCDCLDGYTGENCDININDCDPNQCQNSAICEDLVDDFHCDCQAGFVGTLCEGHQCDSDPCQNNGTCYQNTTITSGYHCDCIKGYTGDHCQSDINECETVECENGGTCLNNPGSYQCICSSGFTGINCSININECLNNSCSLDSVCVDGIDSYSCVCDLGYTGQYCNDRIDYCSIEEGGAACFNNGTCNSYIGYYGCNCPEGFNGSRCDVNIDDCSPDPCENMGNCTDKVNGFICTCAAGYTGLTCNTTIDYCDPNPCGVNEECVVQPSFAVNDDSRPTRNYHCVVCIENICEDPEAVIGRPGSTMPPYPSRSPTLQPIIDDDIDRYTMGMIAGVVVGGAVLACCLFWLFVACCCYCKRRKKEREEFYSVATFEGANEIKENPLFLSPRDLLSSNSFKSRSSSFGRSRKPVDANNPIYDNPNEMRSPLSSETPAGKSTTGTVWYHKLLNPLYKSVVPSRASNGSPRPISPSMHGYAVLKHEDSRGQGDDGCYESIKDPTCDPRISGAYSKLDDDDMSDTKFSGSLHHTIDNPYEPLPPPLPISLDKKEVLVNDLPTDNAVTYDTIASLSTEHNHSESD